MKTIFEKSTNVDGVGFGDCVDEIKQLDEIIYCLKTCPTLSYTLS